VTSLETGRNLRPGQRLSRATFSTTLNSQHGRSVTGYVDNYETCERTLAELRIYSNVIAPTEISRRLGLRPSSSVEKGQVPAVTRTGRSNVGQTNSWILSSDGKMTSRDARRHLDWLLDQLEPVKAELVVLQDTNDVQMHVMCIWWSAFGHGGPIFWPSELLRLSALNLELEIDFAHFGSEPNQ